ncbi:MAG: glutamate formimidoyltransferase [Acidimicrobiales bacterium]
MTAAGDRDRRLECVINVSEGRDGAVLDALAAAAGATLLDLHKDADHHRCVLTLGGPAVEEAARRVATTAVATVDLRRHSGAHPRLGSLDVVPFVPLDGAPLAGALEARNRFARWAADELGLPCFLYGPERSLPEVRRRSFAALAPDTGPPRPHPSAGAVAVGARPPLVAYNLWLVTDDPAVARSLAAELRGPHVRSLGFSLGSAVQVSFNLLSPSEVGPMQVYDAVSSRTGVARAELVGLLPSAVLDAIPPERWHQLDLAADRTIESRLDAASR